MRKIKKAIMPKRHKTPPSHKAARADAERKLRAARAEIKRLRAKTRDCVCAPYTDEDRNDDIRELCDMINKLPPSAYKPGSIYNPNPNPKSDDMTG